jgi:hypothetical protein
MGEMARSGMAKPRAKTLQERMGFMENDLSTPGHDAIMLWLDANMDTNLQGWLGIETWTPTETQLLKELSTLWLGYIQWTHTKTAQANETLLELENGETTGETSEDRIKAAVRYMNHRAIDTEIEAIKAKARLEERSRAEALIGKTSQVLANETYPLSLPPFPGTQVKKKTWEEPITTQREYTIGFMDLVVSWTMPRLSYLPLERYICSINNPPPWRWNEHANWHAWQPEWNVQFEPHETAFEVKTTIPSLGELLRQLKLYEQHFKGKIFVVAPDARFAEKIREQGFGFIQSPQNL